MANFNLNRNRFNQSSQSFDNLKLSTNLVSLDLTDNPTNQNLNNSNRNQQDSNLAKSNLKRFHRRSLQILNSITNHHHHHHHQPNQTNRKSLNRHHSSSISTPCLPLSSSSSSSTLSSFKSSQNHSILNSSSNLSNLSNLKSFSKKISNLKLIQTKNKNHKKFIKISKSINSSITNPSNLNEMISTSKSSSSNYQNSHSNSNLSTSKSQIKNHSKNFRSHQVRPSTSSGYSNIKLPNHILGIKVPNQSLFSFGIPLANCSHHALHRPNQSHSRSKTCNQILIKNSEFYLPSISIRCLEYLDFWGCREEGIYRIPGRLTDIEKLKTLFDAGCDLDLLQLPLSSLDPHAVASVFKLWLRELPDNLFTDSYQDALDQLFNQNHVDPLKLQILTNIIKNLPPSNWYLIRAIAYHLAILSDAAPINRMTLTNFRLIFSPTLKFSPNLLETLIQHRQKLFESPCETNQSDQSSFQPFQSNSQSIQSIQSNPQSVRSNPQYAQSSFQTIQSNPQSIHSSSQSIQSTRSNRIQPNPHLIKKSSQLNLTPIMHSNLHLQASSQSNLISTSTPRPKTANSIRTKSHHIVSKQSLDIPAHNLLDFNFDTEPINLFSNPSEIKSNHQANKSSSSFDSKRPNHTPQNNPQDPTTEPINLASSPHSVNNPVPNKSNKTFLYETSSRSSSLLYGSLPTLPPTNPCRSRTPIADLYLRQTNPLNTPSIDTSSTRSSNSLSLFILPV
ncbi:hypothetical protein O181_035699 [Austropuccinia psidii MF-1]|uniref:Rho-GAP domain-containing protein n=1 Tax=Austropuccinia psidii MF-1 TaxID=1389203 RepID=A0A9Q3HAT1_9BASI|nr:hypothetical protein [Austropuccinia psidii MF-1]